MEVEENVIFVKETDQGEKEIDQLKMMGGPAHNTKPAYSLLHLLDLYDPLGDGISRLVEG